jgi:hypothetical protein
MGRQVKNLHVDTVENALFEVVANPVLKYLISRFDKACPMDGDLLLNSLRDFLGEPVSHMSAYNPKLCKTVL